MYFYVHTFFIGGDSQLAYTSGTRLGRSDGGASIDGGELALSGAGAQGVTFGVPQEVTASRYRYGIEKLRSCLEGKP